ncbi:helix-turn-helix domain-containing protein [Vibrio sp. CAIM 722]|uniref:Helix-turn-helix domain-containing protein n=1 Tax=Vibrio eleionomae TaxID=2653505 RepID=A0A7X4RUX9_9VIBR|nr:helix-turn-helix transcriptional regulator [Vibrio eleionomae]MZI93742.1 helix-turn-helix domain-containing protein [Vibrio eleionomae]
MTTQLLTRKERLGEFLRLKRNSIAPETLGLVKPSRSRTPGLRREDVAELADISTVWYSKLERGKAERVSRQVILNIAKSLLCDDSETRYLLQLSGHTEVPSYTTERKGLSDEVKEMINALSPLPAMMTNDFRDILWVNRAFEQMVGITFDAIPQSERNTVRLMSHNPIWQSWLKADCADSLQDCMQNSAARIRAAMVNRICDQEWQQRLDSLMADCPKFQEIWSNHKIKAKDMLEKEYHHKLLGDMVFRKQYWSHCSEDIVGQLVVFTPVNDSDKQRLSL